MAEVEVKSTSSDVQVITNNAVVFDSLIEQGSGKLSLQLKDPNRVSGSGALGERSVAFGKNTTASGENSHAENYNSVASGINAHAEGRDTIASGEDSHVEGYMSVSNGIYAHAEGLETIASAKSSHAEGIRTESIGIASHAEGELTLAYGKRSHAEGYYTIAINKSEHACGIYNKSNYLAGQSETIFSIGIGSSDTDRKNAVEVMKDGRVFVYGAGGYDGTNPFAGGKSLGELIGDANFGGIVCLTLGGELSTAEVQKIIGTLADIVNNKKHYILTIYDTVSKQFLGDCEVVKSGTNQYTITSNYTTTTLSTYTLYYSFKTDTNTYTRNLYSVKIASENSVSALGEKIDALNDYVTALEARIAALEGA